MSAANGNGRSNGHARGTARGWGVRVIMPGLPLQSAAVLLSRGDEHLVVDTGFPQHDSILLDGLARAGVEASAVSGVINTHFHLDHFGGNFLFPQAWVYGSKTDFDWAVSIYESVCGGETRREVFRNFYPEASDEEFDRMDEARVLQLLKWMWDPATLGDLARYRWWEERALGVEGIHLIATPGHTPGHLAVLVAGDDANYLIAGDARPFHDDNTPALDMPPHNARQFLCARRRLDHFHGVVIPGHDDPFSQEGAAPATAAAAYSYDNAHR